MDPKIYGDFQIYISVPLSLSATAGRSSTTIIFYIAAINFVWGNISLYQTFLWLSQVTVHREKQLDGVHLSQFLASFLGLFWNFQDNLSVKRRWTTTSELLNNLPQNFSVFHLSYMKPFVIQFHDGNHFYQKIYLNPFMTEAVII